jgi:hypothetical protein
MAANKHVNKRGRKNEENKKNEKEHNMAFMGSTNETQNCESTSSDSPCNNEVKQFYSKEEYENLEKLAEKFRVRLINTTEMLFNSEYLLQSCKAKLEECEKSNLGQNKCDCNKIKSELDLSKTKLDHANQLISNCICHKLKVENSDLKVEIENLKSKSLSEIDSLKLEINNLKCENEKLKCEERIVKPTIESINLDKILRGQKPNDKTGLGYKKEKDIRSIPSQPKHIKRPNQIKGHAYMYRNFSRNQNNHNNFPKSNNRFNFKENNFYKPNNYHKVHNKFQSFKTFSNEFHDSYNSSKVQNLSTPNNFYKPHSNYHSSNASHNVSRIRNFSKPNQIRQTRNSKAKCNFCCNHGHISLECAFRKPSFSPKYKWVIKEKSSQVESTSGSGVSKST